jgi:hypothetical protein
VYVSPCKGLRVVEIGSGETCAFRRNSYVLDPFDPLGADRYPTTTYCSNKSDSAAIVRDSPAGAYLPKRGLICLLLRLTKAIPTGRCKDIDVRGVRYYRAQIFERVGVSAKVCEEPIIFGPSPVEWINHPKNRARHGEYQDDRRNNELAGHS